MQSNAQLISFFLVYALVKALLQKNYCSASWSEIWERSFFDIIEKPFLSKHDLWSVSKYCLILIFDYFGNSMELKVKTILKDTIKITNFFIISEHFHFPAYFELFSVQSTTLVSKNFFLFIGCANTCPILIYHVDVFPIVDN